MEKTTVYLTALQKASLARAAQTEGRSEARLIRAGIDAVIAGHRAGESGVALGAEVPGVPPLVGSLERPRWIEREAFVRLVQPHPADAALRSDLDDLAPGTTDDEPLS